MPIGLLFWILMILWFLFGLYWNRTELQGGNYGIMGGNLLLFILLFLLGWKLFGFVVQQAMQFDVNVNVRHWSSAEVAEMARLLIRIANKLETLEGKVDTLMAISKDIKDLVAKVYTATNAIAAKITKLMGQLDGGVSADEAEEIKTQLEPLVAQLDEMGKDPVNPVPPPP